jgi:hypothetical protein
MRTIAVRPSPSEDWENLVTSIAISDKSVKEVEMEQSKLPKLENQTKLFTFAGDFDFCVFEGFTRGEIGQKWIVIPRVGGHAYRVVRIKTRQFNPLELKVCSTQKRSGDSWKYVLFAADNGLSQERERLWTAVQSKEDEAKRLNYSSILELIRDALRIDINNLDRKDFELTITNPAQIKGINFKKSTFEVEIAKITGLRDLQLNVVLKRSTKGGMLDPIWRAIVPIEEREASPLVKTLQPPSLKPYDRIDLNLLHRPSALILDEKYERAPLQNVVEPYFKALDAFCPVGEFKEMLLNPEKSPKNKDKRFENAVAWLLSLAGFHTIYLGEEIRVSKRGNLIAFDVLRNEHGIPVGCADIIAYEDNERLLLVDCDVGGLDDKKIQELVETRNFLETLYNYGELKFVPVLFTPRYLGEDMKSKPVAIVDGNAIENILEYLAKGDKESARSQIQQFYSLKL